jgi:hypothetical protein
VPVVPVPESVLLAPALDDGVAPVVPTLVLELPAAALDDPPAVVVPPLLSPFWPLVPDSPPVPGLTFAEHAARARKTVSELNLAVIGAGSRAQMIEARNVTPQCADADRTW